MRGKGITYDTGFLNGGASTREHFDPAIVQREMRIIHDDLHCNVVRVTGGDPARLELAATYAAEAGLEVWISPFTCNLTRDALLDVITSCAVFAERLRMQGATVVLLTGSELSLFNIGFLPGETLTERLDLLAAPQRLSEQIGLVPARINDFLATAVAAARKRFGGRISYASLPFEGVDWTPFDIISTDAGYRSAEVAAHFRESIRAFVAQGKPAAITEFGCTTYRGAAERGGRGDAIIVWDERARPVGLNGDYVRDEGEQAAYLRELLDIFSTEGVDTAFASTFARYDLPHRSSPPDDLDMASYGVVKVLEESSGNTYPGMSWEPKAAFYALADAFRN
jgi:hypothetical protein